MDDRPVTTQQLEEIIARALELERSGPMLDQEELRAIAREINISPRALEQATQEVLARSERAGATTKEGGVLAPLLEGLAAIAGGVFAGGVAAAGFPVVAVMVVLLMGVGLASRRDLRTIARLMTQWILLCGVFGFVGLLLVGGISLGNLAALFAGGGLLTAAIVWLRERKGLPSPDDQPLLPS